MISQLIKASNICDNSHCFITKQSSQNCVNSSVAIIIKCKKYQNTEKDIFNSQILFLKRKTSSKDRFSGEICFPGGKQQEDQNLYDTVIRQAYQQTNIQLKKSQFIGSLKEKIFVNYSIKKYQEQSLFLPHYLYAFIFFINRQEFQNLNIKLNPHEMQDYKWVGLQHLVKQQNRVFKVFEQKMIPFIKNIVSKNKQLSENIDILQQIQGISYPAINVQMKNYLYGLTLYAISLFLYRLRSFILKQVQLQNQQGKSLKKYNERILSLANYFHGETRFLVKKQSGNKQKIILFQKLFIQQWAILRPKF